MNYGITIKMVGVEKEGNAPLFKFLPTTLVTIDFMDLIFLFKVIFISLPIPVAYLLYLVTFKTHSLFFFLFLTFIFFPFHIIQIWIGCWILLNDDCLFVRTYIQVSFFHLNRYHVAYVMDSYNRSSLHTPWLFKFPPKKAI